MKKGKKNEHKRFAKMFLNHVGAAGSYKGLEELGAVRALMSKSAPVNGFFVGPQFSIGEKSAVLEHLKKGLSLSEGTDKFLKFLIEGDSMGLLDDIMDAAVSLYLERTKRAVAVVSAPVALDKAFEQRLKDVLTKITDRQIDIEYVKDPAVLGGVLVKVGSTMFDGSLKGQLRLLKEELIKG